VAQNDAAALLASQGIPIVDAHVHVFPDRLFEAVWRWFERHAWPVEHRYSLPAIDFLLERGVSRIVALTYAHKPGMARGLNEYVAQLVAARPAVIGAATIFPGEPDTRAILRDAFAAGLRAVKLHCHVQCMAPDAPELDEVYRICSEAGKPVIIHAGREPTNPHYGCDPHALCSADRVARVLERFSALKLVIPHLGADEFDAYARLLERHDHLWLDTAMVLAGYFPFAPPWSLLSIRPERILYGTDFPNLPYQWDRELRAIVDRGLPRDVLANILGANALALFL
jgi:predicted TIM-barrel fold metal-dependent hydrolase